MIKDNLETRIPVNCYPIWDVWLKRNVRENERKSQFSKRKHPGKENITR